MMGGGPQLRGTREAMAEGLARLPPELLAYVDGVRPGVLGLSGGAHRLAWQAGLSEISSGGQELSEWTGRISYSLALGTAALRVSAAPIRFESGDTLSVSGFAPIEVRADLGLSLRDSLEVVVRGPSAPSSLTRPEAEAIAGVGTSVIDLASVQFGTPPSVSLGYTRVARISSWLDLSAEIGVELEPRPGGTEWVYWRGPTVRAGVGLTDGAGATLSGMAVSVTRSFADSLSGRNLFYGGGTLLVRAHGARILPGNALLGVATSYFHPYSTVDAGASGRRVPLGDFAGASVLAALPLGGALLMPAAVLSREWSDTPTSTGVASGSGWALSGSLSVDVVLGGSLVLTPEAGYTRGTVSLEVLTVVGSSPSGPLTRTVGVSDSLSGWWGSVRWSLAF